MNFLKFNNTYDDKLQSSLKSIDDIFSKYRNDEIAVSFNGGKDNIVMIDMILNYITSKYYKTGLPFIFFVDSGNNFPEVLDFIYSTDKKYGLNLSTFNCSMKKALNNIRHEYPSIKFIFMGTRKDDFDEYDLCNIKYYNPTDKDWPSYIRVTPLIFFEYEDIWNYIITNNISYCKLYNEGYTSLGDKNNTDKNPKLRYYNIKTQKYKYMHASKLINSKYERLGRK